MKMKIVNQNHAVSFVNNVTVEVNYAAINIFGVDFGVFHIRNVILTRPYMHHQV